METITSKKHFFMDERFFVPLILIIVAFISYTYTTLEYLVIPIWPLNGIAVGLYLGLKRRNLHYILLGAFLGYSISGLFFETAPFLIQIIISSILCAVLFIEIKLFTYLMDITRSFGFISGKNFLVYLAILGFISLVSGTVLSALFVQVYTQYTFFEFVYAIWLGILLSYLIFGTSTLTSFYFNEPFMKTVKEYLTVLIATLIYLLASTLLFQSYDSAYTFRHYAFVFVILYVFIGFKFSTRITIYFNLIYTLFFQLVYVHTIPKELLLTESLEAIFFLLVLNFTANLIQITLKDLVKKSSTLEKVALQKEDLLENTINLFYISGIPYNRKEKTVENYFIEMFKVATSVFTKFDAASCYLKGDKFVKFVDAIGYDVNRLNQYRFDVDAFIWDLDVPRIILEADTTVHDSLDEQYERFVNENLTLKESIRFSIFVEDHIVGGMSFDIQKGSKLIFTKADVDNYTAFQKTMNSFFAHAMVIQKNETLQTNIVLSLVNALELYDDYTSGHSEDVANLSRLIAEELGLASSQIRNIYWSGITHDIGKIGIDQDIINKKSKLTLSEYEMVKKHAFYGYQVLSKNEDLKDVAIAVKHHHEWWNGAGYPDGLKGEEIPLISQILCVADAVSSMATKRPYSEQRDIQYIKEELERYTGSQFSPRVSKAMIRLIDDGKIDAHYQKEKTSNE